MPTKRQPIAPDKRKIPVLVNVDRQDWYLFQKLHGLGNASARIRELVRADLERHNQ